MELHIINQLRTCNTVRDNLRSFCAVKKISMETLMQANSALEHMDIFIEFFTRLYNIDIICKAEGFYATKSSTFIISITVLAPYNVMFMLFILELIIYCENPF